VSVCQKEILEAYKINLKKAALSAFFHEQVFLTASSDFKLEHKVLDSERSESIFQLVNDTKMTVFKLRKRNV